ncbi:YeeE/YedE family protein [Lacticigenium naphthae]|uniref:YeeE/YedE family protein n=1 Tax=Lacticigenium naphthae TaxID=515351 RepID=UPI00040DA828|nr:YeeE/YedE family protein [Lacticigenium naphthae]
MEKSLPKVSVSNIAGSLLLILLIYIFQLYQSVPLTSAVQLWTGIAFGYLILRANVDFSAGIVEFFNAGNSYQYNSLLMLFAAGIFATVGIHYAAFAGGALPAYLTASSTQFIPGTQTVAPIDLNLLLGSFLFGVGMVINRGCGSATLANIGQGNGRYLFTLFFMLVGTIPGQWIQTVFQKNQVGHLFDPIYLPEKIGYIPTMIVSLAGIGLLFLIGRLYENDRKRNGTFKEVEQVGPAEINDPKQPFNFFERRNLYVLFQKDWSRSAGAFIFALVLVFQLTITKQTFTLTATVKKPALYLLQSSGLFTETAAFQMPLEEMNQGLFANPDVVFLLGILLGAFIYSMLSGTFIWRMNLSGKEAPYFIVSGLLMGFGAVLANGCNVGAVYSGIVNFSLSGWVALVCAFTGAFVSMSVFNGKVHTIQKGG